MFSNTLLAATMGSWASYLRLRKTNHQLRAEAEKKMRGRSLEIALRLRSQKAARNTHRALMLWLLAVQVGRHTESYLSEKELLESFISKQRARSRTIVDRMLRSHNRTLLSWAWQALVQETEAHRAARDKERAQFETKEEVSAIQQQMRASQRQRRDGILGVLERVTASSDRGAISVYLNRWVRRHGEAKIIQKEAERLRGLLKGKKSGARRILEKNIGALVCGLLGSTFNNWKNFIAEQRSVRQLQANAERALRSFKHKMTNESSIIMERLLGQRTVALIQQVLMIWTLAVGESIRTNALQEELSTIMRLHTRLETSITEQLK